MKDALQIRPFKPSSDFNKLLRLNSKLNPDENENIFRNDVTNPKTRVLVAEKDGKILGFVSASFPYWDRVAIIQHLIVKKEHRGHGIGTALLKEIISLCESEKMKIVTVQTALWNQKAIQLYKKLGFIPTAVFPDYIGEGNDMVWMERKL
ncbi:MAG: GNAT family N-acetyltransferase [candidate division WOR-3 bacterium]|jgi:ribosomal protein S18 acetylase RimI-like enzyme